MEISVARVRVPAAASRTFFDPLDTCMPPPV
jgi:hypothetical protein